MRIVNSCSSWLIFFKSRTWSENQQARLAHASRKQNITSLNTRFFTHGVREHSKIARRNSQSCSISVWLRRCPLLNITGAHANFHRPGSTGSHLMALYAAPTPLILGSGKRAVIETIQFRIYGTTPSRTIIGRTHCYGSFFDVWTHTPLRVFVESYSSLALPV